MGTSKGLFHILDYEGYVGKQDACLNYLWILRMKYMACYLVDPP